MARGFWNLYENFNKVVRTFTGPAELGAGHPEEPEVRRADAACPLCGAPMTEHVIQRTADQRTATRLICPAPRAA